MIGLLKGNEEDAVHYRKNKGLMLIADSNIKLNTFLINLLKR
jgi:hypothetical protein